VAALESAAGFGALIFLFFSVFNDLVLPDGLTAREAVTS
jgi:hypothetical protein